MKDFIHKHYNALRTSERHWLRKMVGVLLVMGGVLGFLPVLGYWMLPLGLALLAVDWPIVRRPYRRLIVWWGRLRERVNGSTTMSGRRRNGRSPGKGSGP